MQHAKETTTETKAKNRKLVTVFKYWCNKTTWCRNRDADVEVVVINNTTAGFVDGFWRVSCDRARVGDVLTLFWFDFYRQLVGGWVELDGETSIPANVVSVLSMLWEQYKELKAKLIAFEKEKNALTRQIEPCQRLMEIEGVGETTAAMLYTTLGDGKQFKNGRQASAFVGLTPKQHSSGGKVFMIGIDKCGGVKELRSLLYLGAMSYVGRLPEKPKTQKDAWLRSIIDRIGFKKACIALANKVVRTAWAMLRYETEYKPVLLTD